MQRSFQASFSFQWLRDGSLTLLFGLDLLVDGWSLNMKAHLFCHVFLPLVTSLLMDSDQVIITSSKGEVCVLPCAGPEGRVVILEWTKSDKYLLLYRSGRIESIQDEQFTNRIQLQDPELKSGNLSVILQNVRLEDSGIYRCEASVQTSRDEREVITHIQLIISDQSQIGGIMPVRTVGGAGGAGGAVQNNNRYGVVAVGALVILLF